MHLKRGIFIETWISCLIWTPSISIFPWQEQSYCWSVYIIIWPVRLFVWWLIHVREYYQSLTFFGNWASFWLLRCWWRNVLVTILICWWIWDTNIEILWPTFKNCHQLHNITKITVAVVFEKNLFALWLIPYESYESFRTNYRCLCRFFSPAETSVGQPENRTDENRTKMFIFK